MSRERRRRRQQQQRRQQTPFRRHLGLGARSKSRARKRVAALRATSWMRLTTLSSVAQLTTRVCVCVVFRIWLRRCVRRRSIGASAVKDGLSGGDQTSSPASLAAQVQRRAASKLAAASLGVLQICAANCSLRRRGSIGFSRCAHRTIGRCLHMLAAAAAAAQVSAQVKLG